MSVEVKKPAPEELERLGVKSWGIWEKEKSSFDWFYDSKEICYFLEGDVDIEFKDGKSVSIGEGDLVIFPKGLKCTWHIKKAVKKHYKFER